VHNRDPELAHRIDSISAARSRQAKGLAKVWCWVKDLDDEAAFMELALSNLQGEVSPLEFGIHALNAVPKVAGGRGNKGGFSEYAWGGSKVREYMVAR